MIYLTCYHSGKKNIALLPTQITEIRELPCSVSDYGSLIEHGQRTRIATLSGDIVLVRESLSEISELTSVGIAL